MYDGPNIQREYGVPDVGALSWSRPSDLAAMPGIPGGPGVRRPSGPRPGGGMPRPASDGGDAISIVPRLEGLEQRLPQSAMGYLSPSMPPWGAERIPVEGRLLLPGASGAAAGVATSATAVGNAEGLTVAGSAVDQTVCSILVPGNKIGVVSGYFARPESRLGYDSGHVTFQLDRGGQRTQLPQRLLGVLGGPGAVGFASLIPVFYTALPGTTVAIFATNSSTATWHVVLAAFEIFFVERDAYRRYVSQSV